VEYAYEPAGTLCDFATVTKSWDDGQNVILPAKDDRVTNFADPQPWAYQA
jgi:hypothetical protein